VTPPQEYRRIVAPDNQQSHRSYDDISNSYKYITLNESIPRLVVDLISKTRGIDNSQRNTGSFFVQLELCFRISCVFVTSLSEVLLTDSDRLDLDTFFDMRIRCIIIVFAREHLLAAKGVDKRCSAFSTY
jgi:hypothetical protein